MPRAIMVAGVEHCQLREAIEVLVPYSLLFGAIPAIPRRVTSKPFPARSQRITEDARLLTSWLPEPVSAILGLRGVGILSLHPTGLASLHEVSPGDLREVAGG